MKKNRDIITRLKELKDKLCDENFLKNRGLGNEVPFYVFDYEPSNEYKVRSYIKKEILKRYDSDSDIKVIEIDIYELMIESLKNDGILEKVIESEERSGSETLFKNLKNSFSTSVAIKYITKKAEGSEIVLLTGVGKSFPICTFDTLLSNLQTVLDTQKLIAFFPGKYTKMELVLFEKEKLKANYYRAFKI